MKRITPPHKTTFQKGLSGNPAGRPPGSRNKSTIALEQMLEGEGELLTRKVIELAKQGHFPALRLCIERLIPVGRGRPIELELQPVHNARDIVANLQSTLAAVADGKITPGEAQALAGILSDQARLLESVDVEQRTLRLEAYVSEVKAYQREQTFEIQRFANANKETA